MFAHDPDPIGIHGEMVQLTPQKSRELASKLIAAADAEEAGSLTINQARADAGLSALPLLS